MELKELKVRSNAPYPTITDATNNAKTVRVIKNLMSGYDSELKAVLQYFYQSSLSYKIQPEISKIFEEISVAEMKHMELLSRAIVDFGGDPKYDNGQG